MGSQREHIQRIPENAPLRSVISVNRLDVDARRSSEVPSEFSTVNGHDISEIAIFPPHEQDGLSPRSGRPVPFDIANQASRTFGSPGFEDVRVHIDAVAEQLTDQFGFAAFSYDRDLYFQPDAYQPDTLQGRFILLHELAHVAQTAGQAGSTADVEYNLSSPGDSLEQDANRAASAAIAGRRHTPRHGPVAIRGFGATARRDPLTGARERGAIVHENQTVDAAQEAGFSERDATMIYAGNWQRDMNQLILPKVVQANPAIYELLSIAYTAHFGTPLPSPTEFGSYDPVEHIDNPGGQWAHEVFDQTSATDSASTDYSGTLAPVASEPFFGIKQPFTVTQNSPPLANADPRYRAARDALDQSSILNPDDLPAFQVDESAIPAYLYASRVQLKQQLSQAVGIARTTLERDRALRYAGEALHIMQDYYAHSNFVEVAMNILLGSGAMPQGGASTAQSAAPNAGQPADTARQSLVEILNLAALNPRLSDPGNVHDLNTYVHTVRPNGTPDAGNLTTRGGLQVMATGTFTLEDTAESVKEKLSGAIEHLNPFEKGPSGPSPTGIAVMTWLEANPPYVADVRSTITSIGSTLRTVQPAIDAALAGAGMAQVGMGYLESGLEQGIGALHQGWHSLEAGATRMVGGDSSEVDRAASATRRESEARSAAALAEGTSQRDTALALSARLDGIITQMESGGGLVDLYRFASDVGDLVTLENMAREIPVVGDSIAATVRKAVDGAKERARQALDEIWRQASRQVIAELDAAVSASIGSTEVRNATGSNYMTQPTHTDIAKDFDTDQHGAEETVSVIEELRELVARLGGAEAIGDRAIQVYDDIRQGRTAPLDGMSQILDEISRAPALSHEDEGHRHQQRHGGAWLAGLADDLARASSLAILRIFHDAIATPPAASIDEINEEVDRWFDHPARNRSLWQEPFMARLQAQTVDSMALRAELARRIGLPPSEQAPNMDQM